MEITYDRNIIYEYSPIMLEYIANRNISMNGVLASILEYVRKKYINLTPIFDDNTGEILDYRFEKNSNISFPEESYQILVNPVFPEEKTKEILESEISPSDIYIINRILFDQTDIITYKQIEKLYDNVVDIEEKYYRPHLNTRLMYLKKLLNFELSKKGIISNKPYFLSLKKLLISDLKKNSLKNRYNIKSLSSFIPMSTLTKFDQEISSASNFALLRQRVMRI